MTRKLKKCRVEIGVSWEQNINKMDTVGEEKRSERDTRTRVSSRDAWMVGGREC